MDIEKLKSEMMTQDDGSIECISFHKDGRYYKTVNTYPYRAIKISKEEYYAIKNSGVLKEEDSGQDEILEFYSK